MKQASGKRICAAVIVGVTAPSHSLSQAQEDLIRIVSPHADASFEGNIRTGEIGFSQGATLTYSNITLQAQSGRANQNTGEIDVEGDVLLKQEDQLWRSQSMSFNVNSEALSAESFRLGRSPFYAAGDRVAFDKETGIYKTQGGFLTTEDVQNPGFRIKTSSIELAPDDYIQAKGATVELGGLPVFYFPSYKHDLNSDIQRLEVEPGYRGKFGGLMLNTYNWYSGKKGRAGLELDYLAKRGLGFGHEADYDLGRLGKGDLHVYFLDDKAPETALQGPALPSNRRRIQFSHKASLRPLLTAKTSVFHQSDRQFNREFFDGDHRINPQPKSFLEIQQQGSNYSASLYGRVQIDDYFETIERLPEIRFSAYRQQIAQTPIYYESESTASHLRRRFSDLDPAVDYEAFRADSLHQLVAPYSFNNLFQFIPKMGVRLTHYGEAHGVGATTTEQQRWLFHTGAELNTKLSRTWEGVSNSALDLDGLRHLLMPSLNYVFVPDPNVTPNQIPQFDRRLPSFKLRPINFPEDNAIDAIDARNVLRFGLRNKLQTKRNGRIEDVVNWSLFADWRLDPTGTQTTFSDAYSDLDLRPRDWVSFNSEIQYGLHDSTFKQINHAVTLLPASHWSWSVGHRYIASGVAGSNLENNLLFNSFYYRFNENWGARVSHFFEARDGVMEEQDYSLYRDFRSWVASLAFRIRDQRVEPTDFGVMLRFSIKALPRYDLNEDRDRPNYLHGGRQSDYGS